jgi:hypothetical protein
MLVTITSPAKRLRLKTFAPEYSSNITFLLIRITNLGIQGFRDFEIS